MDADISYFRWKYTQNPAGSFVGFIAIDTFTKEVGAYYGVIPQVFELDGETRTIFQSCDTMTHSNHRRRGLFRKLATHCYDELKAEGKLFVIGFGGGQSTPGFLKFGWKQIFEFRYYFKHSLMCQKVRFSSFDDSTIEVSKALDALDNGLDVSRSQISARAKGIRSPEQIRWRLSNPAHKYLAIQVKGDEESYVIFYVQDDKLILFDFMFADSTSGKSLMHFLSKQVVKKGFRGIISFCQENGEDARILKEHGFAVNPFGKGPMSERVPFIFYSTEEMLGKYLQPSDWTITTYDHDSL